MLRRANIGVRAQDLHGDVRTALSSATALGFAAIEVSAEAEETRPESLTESGRRHFARLVRRQGLDFQALACSSSGRLTDPARIERVVDHAAAVLRLAADMGVPLVSHDLGELSTLPERAQDTVLEALRTLADRADRVGTIYAVRSRACTPHDLADLITRVDSPLVRISVDPATLLMSGVDPQEALQQFGERVVLAYARDAVRGGPGHPGYETALGHGSIDLPGYLAGLAACGLTGPLILHRERSADPLADLAADKEVLDKYIAL